jgi:hypothetical protein
MVRSLQLRRRRSRVPGIYLIYHADDRWAADVRASARQVGPSARAPTTGLDRLRALEQSDAAGSLLPAPRRSALGLPPQERWNVER